MSNPLPSTAAVLILLPALLLGACAQVTGLPSAPTTPVTTPALSATLKVSVFIPDLSGQALRPQYVSAATTSLRVQLGTLDTTLALSAANCVSSSGGQTCTFTLNVTPGAGQLLTVSAYDASSHLMSTSAQTVSLVAGQDNAFSLILIGVAASAAVTPTSRSADITPGPSGTLLLDLGGRYSLGVALKDAAGQTILNPGRPTETVTSSDSRFTVTPTGTGAFTVTVPDPAGTDQSSTLTVRDASGQSLVTQMLTVPAEKITVALSSASPVAGSTLLASAQLTSARSRALPVAGRTVSFSTTDGSVPGSDPTAMTDATGVASLNILSGTTSGTSGTVTASSDGVSGTAGYTSVAGTPSTVTSSVSLTPNAVKVQGSSTLSVTLKDGNNNPVTDAPIITVSGTSTLGPVSQNGNVFSYPVMAAAAPETSVFTIRAGSSVVGTVGLAVSAYPLTVSDGTAALMNGSSQYDFTGSAPHSFTVTETNHPSPFTATSSNTAVAAVSVVGGTLTVTPGSTAGFSTVTVKDAFGQSFTFTVSVTTVSILIN